MYKKLPIYSLPSAWNETGDFRYQRNAFTYVSFLQPRLALSRLGSQCIAMMYV